MGAPVISDPLCRVVGGGLFLRRPRLAAAGETDQVPSSFEVVGDDGADASGQPVQGSVIPYTGEVYKKLGRVLVGREARGTSSSVADPHGSDGGRKSPGPSFFPG